MGDIAKIELFKIFELSTSSSRVVVGFQMVVKLMNLNK